MPVTFRFISDLNRIDRAKWDALAEDGGPFVQYRFLRALEQHGCVGGSTAWQPHHLILERDGELVGAMPGYIKHDSYGEYVFDHAWANAYYQHNLSYYPKWVSAVPFTPVTGPRLLTAKNACPHDISDMVTEALASLKHQGLSSTHVLFSADRPSTLAQAGYLNRLSVQFQWHNYGYRDYSDFLEALTSRKRKSLKKAQRQLEDKKIAIETLTGNQIQDTHIAFFIHCYQRTYLKRSGHYGYLTPDFFQAIFSQMPEQIMLVVARRDDTLIASALFFYDNQGLYGRYWGAQQDVDGLHFACCYTEGIRFAIKHSIPLFNPGTQGEHKILRGFEPLYCYSQHRLFAPPFHDAVADFLSREREVIIDYFHQARDVLPFNSNFIPKLKTNQVSAPPA